MTIAKGRSNTEAELDFLKETLEKMIISVEQKFKDNLTNLKAEIFDIEHDYTISKDEQVSLCKSYYDELDDNLSKLQQARNKLVICIYSIWGVL